MNESVLHLRQYPEKEEIAYPKPGTPNPKVRLIVPSVNYLMEWPCFVCVWRNLLMCLVHLIKVGLTVMKLPKGPRVAIEPPKELAGQVKIAICPFFLVPGPCFYFLSCRSPCWPISSGCRMMCWWSTGWTGSRITASTSGLLCSAPAQFHIWSMYFSIIWASQVPWSTLGRGTWL